MFTSSHACVSRTSKKWLPRPVDNGDMVDKRPGFAKMMVMFIMPTGVDYDQ
jgi:hypothetical protein